jgi:hypothetical protein
MKSMPARMEGCPMVTLNGDVFTLGGYNSANAVAIRILTVI